jgi:hypothetical protein
MMMFQPKDFQPNRPEGTVLYYRIALVIFWVLYAGLPLVFSLALPWDVYFRQGISDAVADFGLGLTVSLIVVLSLLWVLTLVAVTAFVRDLWSFRRWTLVFLLPLFTIQLLMVGQMLIRYHDWVSLATLLTASLSLLLLTVITYVAMKNRIWFSGRKRRLLFQIPLFALLLPSAVIVLANLVFIDQRSVDDADLEPVILTPIPLEENVYSVLPIPRNLGPEEKLAFDRALDEMPQEGIMTLSPQDQWDWINMTQPLVDQFSLAVRASEYQCSDNLNDFSPNARLCPLNNFRQIASIVQEHAYYASEAGDYAAAAAYTGSLYQFGDALASNQQGHLIEKLVAIAIFGMANESLSALLAASEDGRIISDDSKRALRETLEEHHPRPEHLVSAPVMDYQNIKFTLLHPEQLPEADEPFSNDFTMYQIPSSYIWHPNRTLNEFAEVARLQRNNYLASCDNDTYARELEVMVDEAIDQPLIITMLSPNGVGNILKRVVVASVNDVKETVCETQVQTEGLLERLGGA